MRSNFLSKACCVLVCLLCMHTCIAKDLLSSTPTKLCFFENKGQIQDQYGCERTDIQFVLKTPGMNIFIGENQMHYQFQNKENDIITSYRMDVELLKATATDMIVKEEPQEYYENYYLPGCPASGVRAHTFKKVTYKNVYNNIDWVFKLQGNHLDHEFIVHPGGNVNDIQIKYQGATTLQIDKEGNLVATTPIGTIKEHPPVCIHLDNAKNNDEIQYQLKDNVLSYHVVGYKDNLVIDPTLEWGTYFGYDSSLTSFYDIIADKLNYVYGTGLTWSGEAGTIATSGTYSNTYFGYGQAFLVKFDTSGNRFWGTYYGGANGETGLGVAYDAVGNLYMAGQTFDASGIATPGCQQPIFGGGLYDGFIVKFDNTGNRIWATYCGGSGLNNIASISCDTLGYFFVSGQTSDPNNLATPDGYYPTPQGSYDDFLIKYDTNGVKKWGTYYGGPGAEYGGASCNDGANIFLTGQTASTTGIATPFGHQYTYGGGNDAFLVKFDTACHRIWGTYIGGAQQESTGGVACDNIGDVYLFGTTNSDTGGFTTYACYQPFYAGGQDAFITKFQAGGELIWGTYFGGPGMESNTLSRIVTDSAGNVYCAGYTTSDTLIATPGAPQTTFGGGTDDAFVTKFNYSGHIQWSTYYGGEALDEASATAFDGANVYVCGKTKSATHIATPGAFLDSGGGLAHYSQGFLAKYLNTPDTTLSTPKSIVLKTISAIQIIPTVNTGNFNLVGSFTHQENNGKIVIYNISGLVVFQSDLAFNDLGLYKHISLNNDLPAGTYFLKLITTDEVLTQRFEKL